MISPKKLVLFLEKKQLKAESRLAALEHALDDCDWFENFEDNQTWQIFKNEAITYRALKNQADLKPGESIDERIRGWKAIHSLTHDPIERLCHHELLDFLRDDKGEV
jgi:hypothetical protein